MAHEILKSMVDANDEIQVQFMTSDGRWAKPRNGPHWEPNTNYRIKPGPAAARQMRALLEDLARFPGNGMTNTEVENYLNKARAIVGDLRTTVVPTGEVEED